MPRSSGKSPPGTNVRPRAEAKTYLELLLGHVVVGVEQMLGKLEVLVETSLVLSKFGVEILPQLKNGRGESTVVFALLGMLDGLLNSALCEFRQGGSESLGDD
jgi:hypothetical protein